ncbi:MAG TPA: aminoacyl-tRNA hydrolase [Longimicrobiales bacterium]|nr:aminoacyl-tRNA hydrolase [Longimicrobiales bacterium]
MKVICGLGNPGPEYEDTRHNVGWWVVDRLSYDWDLGPFRREGRSLIAGGRVGDHHVRLLKPLTFMNRSGSALGFLRQLEEFDPATDLLVVVDEVALDVGRVRFRPGGSAGGHNGLKSVQTALGTTAYPRLRIGVGPPAPGRDLSDFVLEDFEPDEEEVVAGLLPGLTDAIRDWLDEGIDVAMNRHNR